MSSQTIQFKNAPRILSHASVAGKMEGEGPLGALFDEISQDARFGQDSYEKGESEMFTRCCTLALEKAKLSGKSVQAMLGGDLENQITATGMTARKLKIPLLGLYGACSTMAESLLVGAALCDGGYRENCLCIAGSHFCTAERQYRTPLEYANQRTPAAQWTVTAAGAYILSQNAPNAGHVRITMGTIGRVVDLGVSDANNMGAAMAPAAAATLCAHFEDTGRTPQDYDAIVTGDLGQVGSTLFYDLVRDYGHPVPKEKHLDCGMLIFSPAQDAHAGGSGCGCSASVLSAYLLPRILSGEWHRILFMATGALLSPTTTMQGETIPSVAHAVCLEEAQ